MGNVLHVVVGYLEGFRLLKLVGPEVLPQVLGRCLRVSLVSYSFWGMLLQPIPLHHHPYFPCPDPTSPA